MKTTFTNILNMNKLESNLLRQ